MTKLVCVVWCVICLCLIYHGFGVLAIVGFVLMILRVFGFRKKWDGEGLSAYSVFNEGQRSIPGTFTADQLDKQMRGIYQTASVEDFHDRGEGEKSALKLESITSAEKIRRRESAADAAERRMQENFT